MSTYLQALVIDDDPELHDQLARLLPSEMAGNEIDWDKAYSFPEGVSKVTKRSYDLVVTDVYSGGPQPTWCPSDHPFIRFVDKSLLVDRPTIVSALSPFFEAGIPSIGRRIHDELDRMAGDYMWSFLANRWEHVKSASAADPEHLDRVLRRRSTIYLSKFRLDGEAAVNRTEAEPVDYYVYPPVAANLRLGSLLRERATGEFKIVLTPHCDLVPRFAGPIQTDPVLKADFVLLADTISATDEMTLRASGIASAADGKRKDGAREQMRKAASLPAEVSGIRPQGRLCYLPGFLDIPELYVDLLRLQSVVSSQLAVTYDHVAVLDAPFAEGLQFAFGRLYARVGLPDPNVDILSRRLPVKPEN